LEIIIRDILGKVKQHRDYYESNEAGVCLHLVLPMLKTLGWNPESDEVSPQPSTEEGRPDYGLIKEGKTMLFIEAKKLGTDVSLKEIMRQMGKYAYDVGVEFGLLTNGVQWVLFRSFEKGKGVQERRVWEVNLETDAVKKVIRNLRTIAKDNIDEMDVLIEKMNALEDKWKDLLENKELLAVAISELLLRELSKTMPNIKFELDEIKDFTSEKIEGLQHKERTEWTEEPVKPAEVRPLTTVVASEFKYRRDLGKGIFELKRDPTKRIDVSLPGREVERQLQKLGLCLSTKGAFWGFYYTLRREAGLIGR